MKKRISSLALAIMTVLSLGTISANASTMSVQWTNTDACSPVLVFSGTTAFCEATVMGKSNTSSITGKVFLQKRVNGSYVTMVTWSSKTTYSQTLMLSGSASSCTSGSLYRLGVTATIYNSSGTGETITCYSSAATCP